MFLWAGFRWGKFSVVQLCERTIVRKAILLGGNYPSGNVVREPIIQGTVIRGAIIRRVIFRGQCSSGEIGPATLLKRDFFLDPIEKIG